MVSPYNEVSKINEVLTLHMGPQYILLTLSVDFFDDIPVGHVENTIHSITGKIKGEFPRIKRVFIEAEKCPK